MYPCWYSRVSIDMMRHRDQVSKTYRKHGLLSGKASARKLDRSIKAQLQHDFQEFLQSAQDKVKSGPTQLWSHVEAKRESSRIPGRISYVGRTLMSSRKSSARLPSTLVLGLLRRIRDSLCSCDVVEAAKKMKAKFTAGDEGNAALLYFLVDSNNVPPYISFREDVLNYRPIAIIPNFAKLL